MKYLVDTNVWLELLLEQQEAEQVRHFLEQTDTSLMVISEFSLYSLGVILTRLGKEQVFEEFLLDTLIQTNLSKARLNSHDLLRLLAVKSSFQLDFDDAYQYAAADKYGLTIVSFDKDFDSTPLGRKLPQDVT